MQQQFCLSYKPCGYFSRKCVISSVYETRSEAQNAFDADSRLPNIDRIWLYDADGADTVRVSELGQNCKILDYNGDTVKIECTVKDKRFNIIHFRVDGDNDPALRARYYLSQTFNGVMLDGRYTYIFDNTKLVFSNLAFARWLCKTIEVVCKADTSVVFY